MFQDKAQTAKNGPMVLLKGCNTDWDIWVARSFAVLRLGQGQPLPARRAWRPTASRLAEPNNSGLTEHLPCQGTDYE